MKNRIPEIKEQVMDNGSYKLVSLLAAIILWLMVLGRKDSIATRFVDLDILMQSDHVITNTITDTVRVRLSGPPMSLKKFNNLNSTMIVNMKANKAGDYVLNLEKEGVLNLPLGVKVLSVRPNTLKVSLENKR